jgi:hypothetical protein
VDLVEVDRVIRGGAHNVDRHRDQAKDTAPDQTVRGMTTSATCPEKVSLRAPTPSGTRCARRCEPAVRMRIRASRVSLKPCPESCT